MPPYDLATRAQVLTLAQLGLSTQDIEERIGINPNNAKEIILSAIRRGFDPTKQQLINAKYVSGSASLNELPVELQLNIISHLDLTSLIKMRVSTYWRDLMKSQTTKPGVIHPARKALLSLYYEIVNEPWFLATREHTISHLGLFCDLGESPETRRIHRQRWAESFRHYDSLPEEFRIWAFEWPSAAAFAWIWPGLPRNFDSQEEVRWMWSGTLNMLSTKERQEYERDFAAFEIIPGSTFVELAPHGELRFTKEEWSNFRPMYTDTEIDDFWVVHAQGIMVRSSGELPSEEDEEDPKEWDNPLMLICEEGNPFDGYVIQAESYGFISLGEDGELSLLSNEVCCSSWSQFLKEESLRMKRMYKVHLDLQKMKELSKGKAKCSKRKHSGNELSEGNARRRSQRLLDRNNSGSVD